MRGVLIRGAIGAVIIIIGFTITAVVLNASVYTPASFVRGYLDALTRHDAAAAIALAGPAPTSSSSTALLVPSVMSDISSVSVTDAGERDGVHTVNVDYTADGHVGSTTFQVVRTGAVLGIFPTWGFTESPLAEVEVTVQHARDFTANGVRFVNPVQDVATDYLAFTPGVLTFAESSELLVANPQTVVLGAPGASRPVAIDAEANAAFSALVTGKVKDYLDGCASQQQLFPAGCPFGQQITDRYVGSPTWKITTYPSIDIAPSAEPGVWTLPPASGVAHLDVDVESLSDGSVSHLSTDVPYTIGFTVTVVGADDAVVTPQLGASG